MAPPQKREQAWALVLSEAVLGETRVRTDFP
jgi:hypothetical protein